MKTITYLEQMEKARARCQTVQKNHKFLNKWTRQYWKFRARLLQRIERLEQFQKDYAGLILAHSSRNWTSKGGATTTIILDKEVDIYSLPEELIHEKI